MLEPDEILATLTGRGIVAAEGCEPVRVRYRVLIERRRNAVFAHGTLCGSHAGLRPIWLEPDSSLRLKTGRTIPISLTDLVGDVAEFESTTPVAGF